MENLRENELLVTGLATAIWSIVLYGIFSDRLSGVYQSCHRLLDHLESQIIRQHKYPVWHAIRPTAQRIVYGNFVCYLFLVFFCALFGVVVGYLFSQGDTFGWLAFAIIDFATLLVTFRYDRFEHHALSIDADSNLTSWAVRLKEKCIIAKANQLESQLWMIMP